MRDARRTTFGIALCLLLGSLSLSAQTYPNGLATDSVDPRGDAVFIRQIRHRLDDIRAEQNRPTVGLVLSGGGAKGAAEVGAIKYIEELGIPIDFVCGTSIGGLVGGLYALGYRAEDIEELFRTRDWDTILSDRIPTEYISYSDKMDGATFLFSIPFYASTGSPDPATRRERLHPPRKNTSLKEALQTPSDPVTLGSTLPSGFAYGFNVGNLLSSLTVGYQDSISFSRLPIPFVCVAGDVVSSNAKNWGSGSITSAMRSTMSIPGLFFPVRVGDMILVDGGVRNNFPADIARAVGADYLIGIELSDAAPESKDINNLGDILGQFITMLGKDAFARNIGKSDVFIKPSLKEYNMLSFNAEAVDSMLVRGYRAAEEQRSGLLSIRERTGRARDSKINKAVDISKTPVQIGSIEYDGLTDAASARVAHMMQLDITRKMDKDYLDEAMARLQAMGAFETLSYSLYGEQEPYHLVFHCTPAPAHRFSLGLRADTEEGAALYFRIGLGVNRLSGSKMDFSARVGQNLRGSFHYALDLADLPTLNFNATVARYRGSLGNAWDELRYDVAYWSHREEVYVSGMNWTRLDLRAGIANKAYSLAPQTVFAREMTVSGASLNSDYIGTYLLGHLYTLDDYYFPTHGMSFSFKVDYDFLRPGHSDFSPILSGGLDFRMAIPISSRLTFLPDIRLRAITHFGEQVNDGLFHTNFIGGTLPGRYTSDQLPFFGFNHVLAVGDYVVDATAGMRFTLVPNVHLSALAGLLYYDNSVSGLLSSLVPEAFALGVEAAYNTIAGPVRFNFHWSNLQGWGAYFSVGFDF